MDLDPYECLKVESPDIGWYTAAHVVGDEEADEAGRRKRKCRSESREEDYVMYTHKIYYIYIYI